MEQKTEIKKIERTDPEVDNSYYELKIPYVHEDDYGNVGTFYRKETKLCSEYDEQLAKELQNNQEQTTKILQQKAELETAKEKIELESIK